MCMCMFVYVERIVLCPYATLAAHNGDSDLSRAETFFGGDIKFVKIK